MRICLTLITGALIFFAISSCKKDDSPPVAPSSYDYVPTLTGHWVIYDVDSTAYISNDNNQTNDTVISFHFQLKECITSTFIDGEGRPTQRIARYRRDNDSSAWNISNVWTSTLTAYNAQREENNITYIRLGFPINANITWNGNAYNSLGEEDYQYEYFHQPLSLAGFNFDSTLAVVPTLQVDNNNFVEIIYEEDIYAVHVGRISYKYQNLLLNPGQQIVSGLDYSEIVNSYGNN